MKKSVIIVFLFFICINISNCYGQLVLKFEWTKAIGDYVGTEGYAIGIDSVGNVYTAGLFKDTMDFDPGPGVFNLIGSSDIFISKLDSSGSFIWVGQLTGDNNDEANSIAVDTSGNVYTTGGSDSYITDYDPGFGIYPINTQGQAIYINKLSQCLSTSGSISVTACNNYISPSGYYTWSNNGI